MKACIQFSLKLVGKKWTSQHENAKNKKPTSLQAKFFIGNPGWKLPSGALGGSCGRAGGNDSRRGVSVDRPRELLMEWAVVWKSRVLIGEVDT